MPPCSWKAQPARRLCARRHGAARIRFVWARMRRVEMPTPLMPGRAAKWRVARAPCTSGGARLTPSASFVLRRGGNACFGPAACTAITPCVPHEKEIGPWSHRTQPNCRRNSSTPLRSATARPSGRSSCSAPAATTRAAMSQSAPRFAESAPRSQASLAHRPQPHRRASASPPCFAGSRGDSKRSRSRSSRSRAQQSRAPPKIVPFTPPPSPPYPPPPRRRA